MLSGTEWVFSDLQRAHDLCAEHFDRIFGFPLYENQLEIICAEQMLDAIAAVGLPVHYGHWSFGKAFLSSQRNYLAGRSPLAYEIVLNTRPAIAYLMETNTLAMQVLVIAHACFGHNAVFANNYLFKERSHADAILDYCVFARDYVRRCEDRYGIDRVEETLDAAHALQDHGIDRYQRPTRLDSKRERDAQAERMRAAMAANAQHELVSLRPTSSQGEPALFSKPERFPAEPHDNLLYFIEKHSPSLEPWQRELVRIVRKFAEYFHPQRLTKVLNEGFASFTHYTLLNALHEAGQLSDSNFLETMESHTSVIRQAPYSGLNPYALGFAVFKDLRRICEQPDAQDEALMPGVAGRPLREVAGEAISQYRDDSFLLQYLTPRVARDLKLFAFSADAGATEWNVDAVQDLEGFSVVRSQLARHYQLDQQVPEIEVFDFARANTRALTLRYRPIAGRQLDTEAATRVMRHVKRLWNFPIRMLEAEEGAGSGKLLLTV